LLAVVYYFHLMVEVLLVVELMPLNSQLLNSLNYLLRLMPMNLPQMMQPN
jgi:hypothetical protein